MELRGLILMTTVCFQVFFIFGYMDFFWGGGYSENREMLTPAFKGAINKGCLKHLIAKINCKKRHFAFRPHFSHYQV